MRRALSILLVVGACSPASPDGPAPDVLDALELPVFERRVAARIAELEAANRPLASEPGRLPEEGELPALVDLFLNGRGRMREVPLTEMATLGDAAVPQLVAMTTDESLAGEVRNAALHLVFATGSVAALERVVEVLESAREPWRRRYAAWLLGQSDDDRFLLRMLLALRYEKDGETVVWLADALARRGNYAGLEGLGSVAGQGGAAAELAVAKQQELVASLPAVADLADLEELWASSRSHDALRREPSDALRLAAWVELGELSSERFQLRGVDDARFVLSRTGPWGARLVAQALVDEDPYVRLHATQVLERMGARARPVVGALHPLLRDPRTAHAAAEALGAIGAPESLPLLRAALRPHRAHELRVAAAHGLRRLGDASAGPDLRVLIEDEAAPSDLRLAAAAALSTCTGDPSAVAVLVDGMGDPMGDPQGCEVALERWIRENAESGNAGSGDAESGSERFRALLAAWSELEGPPALLRTPEQTRARLLDRAALVGDFLDRR